MKPLLINTSDIHGGAARAAYRLHQGLQHIGVESKMLVQKKLSDDLSVIGPRASIKGPNASRWNTLSVTRYLIDRLPLMHYNRQNFHLMDWSPQWVPNNISRRIDRIDPDIVHLHWICQGFIPVQEIKKIKQPLIWTFHDMWAFTGGCHYDFTCVRYQETCGKCPQLGSDKKNDLSNWVWKRKKEYWSERDFTVVTPSKWLADCARSSSLLADKKIEVIPNGLDLDKFKLVDKVEARKTLNLPIEKNLILFGAINSLEDKRKGFQLLKTAINLLSSGSDFEAVIFGNLSEGEQLDIPVNYLGKLPENMLSSVYSAADVMVVPSLQEAFGQTASEAMACGTPVVCFGSTGLLDIVQHQKTGYLAKPYDSEDLAQGIKWVVEQDRRKKNLSKASRNYVEKNFELKMIAEKYRELYSSTC